MAGFFVKLENVNLISDWSAFFDWLFDDNRFDGCTLGYMGVFTKTIKRMEGIGKTNYQYDAAKNLSFSQRRSSIIKVMHAKGGSEGRDLVRHIRNSVAHGHAVISYIKGMPFVEIKDFTPAREQTAYMFFPLDYLKTIHETFLQINKSKENNRSKKRQ